MRHYHEDSDSPKDERSMHWRQRGIGARIAIFAAGIVVAAGLFVLAGYIVVWLWNWLMPVLFHLTVITFWQAWGLLILAAFFFKRPFSTANRFRRDRRRRQVLRERLQNIGDEEENRSGTDSDRGPGPGNAGGGESGGPGPVGGPGSGTDTDREPDAGGAI